MCSLAHQPGLSANPAMRQGQVLLSVRLGLLIFGAGAPVPAPLGWRGMKGLRVHVSEPSSRSRHRGWAAKRTGGFGGSLFELFRTSWDHSTSAGTLKGAVLPKLALLFTSIGLRQSNPLTWSGGQLGRHCGGDRIFREMPQRQCSTRRDLTARLELWALPRWWCCVTFQGPDLCQPCSQCIIWGWVVAFLNRS